GLLCLNGASPETPRARCAAGLHEASFENVDRSRSAPVVVELDIASTGPPEQPRVEPFPGEDGLVPSLAHARTDWTAEQAPLGDGAGPSQATNSGKKLGRSGPRNLRSRDQGRYSQRVHRILHF